MARTKTTAPAPLTENLGATLPAVINQEAEHNRRRDEIIAKVEAAFDFGDEYSRVAMLGALDATVNDSVILQCKLGVICIRIKAHEGHGEFMRILQERNLHPRHVQRCMAMAGRLIGPDGKARPILLAIAGTRGELSKAHELQSLSDNELDALDAGDTIYGINIESVAAMSAREFREQLAAKDAVLDAKTEELAARAEELEAADREIRRLKRGGKEVEAEIYVDALAEANDDVHAGMVDVTNGLARLKKATATFAQTETPSHVSDTAVCANAVALYQNTLTLARTIAAVLREQEASLAKYIDRPLDDVRGLDDEL